MSQQLSETNIFLFKTTACIRYRYRGVSTIKIIVSCVFILSFVEHGSGKAQLQQWSVHSPVKILCRQTEGLSFLATMDEIRCTFSVHLVYI